MTHYNNWFLVNADDKSQAVGFVIDFLGPRTGEFGTIDSFGLGGRYTWSDQKGSSLESLAISKLRRRLPAKTRGTAKS